jgi:P pilus assembly chaperone PapD
MIYSSQRLTNFLFSAFTCLLILTSFNVHALGQLMVSPTRIVFEGNERTKQINLINNGSEIGRFRISFVRRDMTAEGRIKVVEENQPGLYSDEMIRFSPRQVTLAPGQSQTVRLMLRKKSGTVDGEYRSHMMFQSLPDPATSDVNNVSSSKEGELSIQLIPVVGITIPVIVRQGKLSDEISLSDFEIIMGNTVKAQPSLSLTINRDGNKSAYGDFRVYFTPKGSTPVVIGQISGVAIYTSTSSRKLDIQLTTPAGLELSNGELHVIFLSPGKDEKAGLIAESRFAVP